MKTGFTLHNGLKILGPTVLFPRQAICWNITSGEHINDATLSLLTILEPKPDLLIIGLDDKYDFLFIRSIQELIRKHNIIVEILPVFKACTVFNFVNEEGRYVVAALIPPKQSQELIVRRVTKTTTDSVDPKNREGNSVRTIKI